MSFFKEFKEFALRGNAIEMAIGIVIGLAFGKVISSLVEDILMPPIGLLIGNVDFSKLAIVLKENVSIRIGAFVNTIVNFILIALSIFFVVKMMSKAAKHKH